MIKNAKERRLQNESLTAMIGRQSTREIELIAQVLKAQAEAAVLQLHNYIASMKENVECKPQP